MGSRQWRCLNDEPLAVRPQTVFQVWEEINSKQLHGNRMHSKIISMWKGQRSESTMVCNKKQDCEIGSCSRRDGDRQCEEGGEAEEKQQDYHTPWFTIDGDKVLADIHRNKFILPEGPCLISFPRHERIVENWGLDFEEAMTITTLDGYLVVVKKCCSEFSNHQHQSYESVIYPNRCNSWS